MLHAPAARSLYRRLLRAVRQAPTRRLRVKLAFNVREVYALRRAETDPVRVQAHLDGGEQDLATLRRILGADDQATLRSLFWHNHLDGGSGDDGERQGR